jgi:sulfate permease, SulP family
VGRTRFRRRSGHDRARAEDLACRLVAERRPADRRQTFDRRVAVQPGGTDDAARDPRAATAAGRWLRSIKPERRYLRADLTAGLPGAISSVPDGMAAAVLVGVNPVQGLYAAFAGPITGGLSSSTRLMVITTTSAAALAAGSALQGVPADQRPGALLLLALMVGVVLVAGGLVRVGRYTRFVSDSVMIGFLTGISVNIVCNQVANLTGVKATGDFPLAKAVDVLIHPGSIDVASLLTGLGALAILVLLARTRLAVVGALVALVIPTVVVILAGADSVARVGSVGAIPRGVPVPRLPDFGLFSFSLVVGALAAGRGDRSRSGRRGGRGRA